MNATERRMVNAIRERRDRICSGNTRVLVIQHSRKSRNSIMTIHVIIKGDIIARLYIGRAGVELSVDRRYQAEAHYLPVVRSRLKILRKIFGEGTGN